MFSRIWGTQPQSEKQTIREVIGRAVLSVTSLFWDRFRYVKSIDQSIPDYVYWDKFRRGILPGFELGGLLAHPISQIIASWVIGDGVKAQLSEQSDDPKNENDPINYTNKLIARFMTRHRGNIAAMLMDVYGLGDQYFVVNMDGTISVPSPETVKKVPHPLDHRQIEKYIITTKLDDATIEDEYRLDGRTIRIKWQKTDVLGRKLKADEAMHFPNLIGRIPIIHFANNRGTNETHGRPIYEALRHLFAHYDDLLVKMLNGAKLMGNPIPSFEGLQNIEATMLSLASGTEMYEDEITGETLQRPIIDFADIPAFFLGTGETFKFASPQTGFTDDIRNTLKSLYLLTMEHIRIPDAVWGFELTSSRSTAVEQMKTFFSFIWFKRLQIEGEAGDDELGVEAQSGLHGLLDIWLRVRKLTDRRVVVGPVHMQWTPLDEENDELLLKKAESAHNRGVIRDETYLKALQLVDDPAEEVQLANEENEDADLKAEDDFQQALDDGLAEGDDALEEAA